MNNLYDISMDRRFAGAFGYTEKELEDNFGEGMDEYLEANPGIYGSKEEFIGRIRDYYDGYRFSPDSEVKVYNPVSIGMFFSDFCLISASLITTGRRRADQRWQWNLPEDITLQRSIMMKSFL